MDHLFADLLLGLIEGITEFLPISSTGHLLIAERWLGARSDLFNIAIQAGAILAVVLIYRERLWQLLLGWRERANRDYALKLGVAFAVTAVLGLAVKKLGFELPETVGPVAWALVIGGVVMLAAEAIAARRGERGDVITWPVAVLVGVAQVVAGVFPGTSRSAAAIFAALLFGTGNRLVATEFAFLIGIPTMFAATGYELLHVLRDGGGANEDWTGLAVAFATSAVTAFVVVKWLLGYIQTHRFTVFSWYRIALGVVLLALPAPSASNHPADGDPAGSRGASAAVDSPSSRARGSAAAMSPGSPTSQVVDGRRGASAREQADRAFLALKLCIQGMQASRAMDEHPEARLDTERVARGLGPASADPVWAAKIRSMAALSLERAARARRDCDPNDPHLEDGSIYDLALAAARLGNMDAAECYLAAAFPMSKQRWEDPSFWNEVRREAPRLIDRGVAAGDWRILQRARMIYAPAPFPRLPEPWREPALVMPRLVVPEGDDVRYYAFAKLGALGQVDRPWGNDDAVVRLAGSPLTPAQRASADAWAGRMFATAFGGRPKPVTPPDFVCE